MKTIRNKKGNFTNIEKNQIGTKKLQQYGAFNVTDTLQTKYVQTFNHEITSYITASGQVVLGYMSSDLKISLKISLEFCSQEIKKSNTSTLGSAGIQEIHLN